LSRESIRALHAAPLQRRGAGYTAGIMGVIVAMLRGVNVGGRNLIAMADLRALCAGLKLRDAQTYVQSGNVVFRTDERDRAMLATRLEKAIERKCGFRPSVILRTAAELKRVIARNPLAKRRGVEPAKLLVSFLAGEPDAEARRKVREMKPDPEEIWIEGSELYIYFPNGMGKSKVPWSRMDKILGVAGTGRNWNSVLKLLEMAEAMETGE
jgi:uncharacterized protein (DUF1697 family)